MKSAYLLLLCLLIHAPELLSQCSDAGVCTIGKHFGMKDRVDPSSISLGYIYGYSGEAPDINGNLNDLSFGSVLLDGEIGITENLRAGLNIPYTFISGPEGENHGLGDMIVVFTRSFTIQKKHGLTFQLGGKFATGKVNSDDSLPQRYMPGLGTNDLLAGALYSIENYYFGIGYQMPFGRSDNYVTRLKRGDDILFRAGFREQFNKFHVKAEILTILRIQPSSVLDNASSEERFIEIDGSNEPQVNLLAVVSYRASKELGVTGQAAIPFLQRDYNFDGLKRTISLSGSINYFFNLQ
jgi:hypothetical protein